MPRENVVITGVGIVSAIGIGQDRFFQGLLDGASGIGSLSTRTDDDVVPGEQDSIDGHWIAAPVTDFVPKEHVRPRKAMKVMCREIQMGFASAHLAIEHAGLASQIPAQVDGEIRPDRLGTVYGGEIYFSPPSELVEAVRGCIDESGVPQTGRFGEAAKKEVMPLWMLKYLPNMPACQVGISLNAQGPNNSLVLGDVSGPAALIEGESYLQRGIADVMLIGATGTKINGAHLPYRRDSPTATRAAHDIADASRPHDPDATGIVGGEGAASLVVETESHAASRGAKVLARVVAMASRFSPSAAMRAGERSADVAPVHSRGAGDAIALAVKQVLDQAELAATEIGLVVSHAMGDPSVDAAEARSLSALGIDCPVIAVMSSIGHTGAASGMIEIAAGALVIDEQTVPPNRHRPAGTPINFLSRPGKLAKPYVLCVTHTTEGSATAVLLGPQSR